MTVQRTVSGKFRFSLAGLLGLVLLVAVGLAAMRYASELLASCFLTLTLAALLVASLAALLGRRSRPFWVGFAMFGWVYSLVVFWPWTLGSPNQTDLLTTHLLRFLHRNMHIPGPNWHVGTSVSVEWHGSWFSASIIEMRGRQYKIRYDGYDASSDEWVGPDRMGPARVPWEYFHQIGQSLFTCMLALVGGLLARWWSEAHDGSS